MTVTARPLSVLVVDDNLDTALGLSLLIRAWGHQPSITYDGLSAIQAALDCHANVVLLDIGLPGLDGCEVARQLRQQAALTDVVLVAVTGCADDEDKRRSTEAGFDHYLVKPANIGRLQEIVAKVSRRRPDAGCGEDALRFRHSRGLAKGKNPMPTTATSHRVLVVDDNQDGANALGLLVEELGNQVHVTYGGTKALEPVTKLAFAS